MIIVVQDQESSHKIREREKFPFILLKYVKYSSLHPSEISEKRG